MDKTFRLRQSLLKAVMVQTTGNYISVHQKHAGVHHGLCRNVSMNVICHRKQPLDGVPWYAVMYPKRVPSASAGTSSRVPPKTSGRHITGTSIFQTQQDVLNYQRNCVRNLSGSRDHSDPSSSDERTPGVCGNASSEPRVLSHLEGDQFSGRSSAGERIDVEERTPKRMSYMEARRQGVLRGRRSLSPLERVDGMLGAFSDTDTPSVSERPSVHASAQNVSSINAIAVVEGGKLTCSFSHKTAVSVSGGGDDRSGVTMDNCTGFQNDHPMIDGEMVLAIRENFKRHEYLCRMFLLNASKEFRSKYGTISHADIVGHLAGKTFSTDLGIDVMIRRPTLEEFVLYMKRTPVISYPKDCCSMLMMIDASPGDVILEAGTGSGAMTLFLSRAVGSTGCIHTFEAKPEHQKRAVKNVRQWAASWNISRPHQHWPENICFHLGKLESCDKILDSALLVDGAVIDMETPHLAMPTLATRLKSGKAAVLYVANITQIIDVAEFLRVHSLPLTIEKTLEVTHKVWVVNQARRHSGSSLGVARLGTDSEMQSDDSDAENEDSSSSVQYIKDHVPKYIARPHNLQPGHSAFLVKIRKIGSASATYRM